MSELFYSEFHSKASIKKSTLISTEQWKKWEVSAAQRQIIKGEEISVCMEKVIQQYCVFEFSMTLPAYCWEKWDFSTGDIDLYPQLMVIG